MSSPFPNKIIFCSSCKFSFVYTFGVIFPGMKVTCKECVKECGIYVLIDIPPLPEELNRKDVVYIGTDYYDKRTHKRK
jgi:hypothetical protein